MGTGVDAPVLNGAAFPVGEARLFALIGWEREGLVTTLSSHSSELLDAALCYRRYTPDRMSENNNEDSHCIRPRRL